MYAIACMVCMCARVLAWGICRKISLIKLPLSNDTIQSSSKMFQIVNTRYNGCATRMDKSAAGRAEAVSKIKLLENVALAYDGFSMLVCTIFSKKYLTFM